LFFKKFYGFVSCLYARFHIFYFIFFRFILHQRKNFFCPI